MNDLAPIGEVLGDLVTESPRAHWSERIIASWRDSLLAIIETGRLLAQARDVLLHGEWTAMIEADLPFSPRTAQRLIAIAQDPRIASLAADATHGSLLPASWRTLYEISRLGDEEFRDRIADGTINPDMTRADIEETRLAGEMSDAEAGAGEARGSAPVDDKITKAALDEAEEGAGRTAETRRQLALDLSDAAALSPAGRKFPIVYADPPWRRKAGIGDRAYENHYPTMSWDEILALPVARRVLGDAWLFLWIPRPHLMALHPVEVETALGRVTVEMPLAWAVAQAWGFDAYSTCFVWTKTDEAQPDDHGMGLLVWDQDEILCLFKRGRGLPKPDPDQKVGSNHRERALAHSAKPAYYRDMINQMTGSLPVLELFAREDEDHVLPANFFTWGNQSNNTAELDWSDVSPDGPLRGQEEFLP